MSSTMPDISIVLVSWNTRDLLLACLDSLPAALGGLHAEIWVVDNGSTDGSREAIRLRAPAVQLIENEQNVGFAAANNQAMAMARGRYVLLLNSDTEAMPGSIGRLVAFADSKPRAGIVGARLVNPDATFQASFSCFPTLLSEVLSATGIGARVFGRWYPNYGPQASQHTRSVDWVQGACMLARRSALDQIGLMDEQYFMYNEEIDWCWQCWHAGWQVWYLAEATILHHGGQSTRQVRAAMVQALYRSKVRFFRKHYGPFHAKLLQGALVATLRAKWLLRTLARRRRTSDVPLAWADLASTS